MSTLSPNDLLTTDARNQPTGIVSTPTCLAVVLQALSARTVAIASCNVLKLKPHRQSIHLFLQGELSVDPTPLKPGGASDDPSEMVERLQPVEPVENEPVDVGLRDGATQVTSTLGAVSAVDINGVEVAGSVGTEEPSRATPTTGTPLAETVGLDKKAPVVSTDASKVVLTVGAAPAVDANAVETAPDVPAETKAKSFESCVVDRARRVADSRRLHNARKWGDLNGQQDQAWASRTISQPSNNKRAIDDDLNVPAGSVVTDDPGKATTAIEAPLVEVVNPVDDTPNVSGKVDDALKESGKLH